MQGNKFKIKSDYKPAGDQPKAVEVLLESLKKKSKYQTLLGVTGSGKTYTMANIIEALQCPALVIAHNKTLAAQLYSEFKDLFPDNAVEYFVSYYDYYQPEAYLPATDTYIEKDSSINEEIDKLRHSATAALFERNDVIIIASVSCIYGLGDPEDYSELMISLRPGMMIARDYVIDRLIDIQYTRNDIEFVRGRFRVRGDIIEIFPSDSGERAVRVEFFGDQVERISEFDPITGRAVGLMSHLAVFPASHFATHREKMLKAIETIKTELAHRIKFFRDNNKLIEAQRVEERTMYDIEMLREAGFCSGIENYSRHISGREPGSSPYTLIDYFPDDFITFIDESHVMLPQLRGMYNGDRSRKENLVEYGFRLPCAYDNRPLKFEEFLEKTGRLVFVSATPAAFEYENSGVVAEQVIRPTGLIDPEVIIRPVKNQIDDLMAEINEIAKKGGRVLVTTLTKKMAEDLTDYLGTYNIRVKYLHSEVETLERVEIIRDLRLGKFDVLVGINLLREGLDIPEVELVAILDADKEGLFRSETSLIQTMGRAARNVNGRVILYADEITGSIDRAVRETNRRRQKQIEYNTANNITPKTIVKHIYDSIRIVKETSSDDYDVFDDTLTAEEIQNLIIALRKDMKACAIRLEFEKAAELRDKIEFLAKKIK